MKVHYESMFRQAFEVRPAIAWAVAAVYCAVLGLVSNLSPATTLALVGVAAGMAAARAWQVRRLWIAKIALAGRPFAFLDAERLRTALPTIGDNLWLGWGWRWQPSHTQKANEALERDLAEIYPPRWFLDAVKAQVRDPSQEKGLQWIHGLDEEKDVLIPLKALDGHTWIAATTGAIKTTLFGLLVAQFALRREPVIIFDPKGDKDLENMARQCAAWSGDPTRFIKLHPAFPSSSVRIDALKTWDRETQVASRIQMVMSADEDSSFVSFCWLTTFNITAALKYVGRRPTLVTFLDAIQSLENAARLLEEAMIKYFREHVKGYEVLISARMQSQDFGKRAAAKSALSGASERLLALIDYYKAEVEPDRQRREITGMISMLENNREWFGKMVIQLVPLLAKLTAGDLNELLSPRYDDIDDSRPIYDMRSVIEGGKIFYIGLDALSDKSVASALAALLLSDAASVAGELYNYGDARDDRKINILMDEWGDLLCEPVIQMANKGRGAGYRLFLAGQSLSDAVDKMGSLPKAKRVVANLNNLIAGASNDKDTVDLIMEKVGETYIRKVSVSQGAGQKTEDTGLEFSGNRSESIGKDRVELFPASLFPNLPDLHYLAVVNRGTVIKGRIAKLLLPTATA